MADFEKYAATALGTDDPDQISALKEAIMACMGDEEKGEYDGGDGEKPEKSSGLALLFGGGKK